MNFTDLRIVLVGTLYPRNAGACSRAADNMGASQMYFVDRKCELDVQAREGAAGAQGPLQNAKEYSSLEELQKHEPFGCFIALTRRTGALRNPFPLKQTIDKALEMELPNGPLYLVFGPEDAGLTDEQIKLCNLSAELPVYGKYPSLNLAQAVLLASFVVQEKLSDTPMSASVEKEESKPFPLELFDTWLKETGYDLTRNKNASSKLLRMFQRAIPTPKEVELLQAALWQNVRKLRELRTSNLNPKDELNSTDQGPVS